MRQLLRMLANGPTDAEFSVTGLIERGGGSDIHRDGCGIAFYRGRGVQEFRDPQLGIESDIARLASRSGIKSTLLISHIRRANIGRVSVENTHPFVRELWGNYWTFAHNRQLRGAKKTFVSVALNQSEAPIVSMRFVGCSIALKSLLRRDQNRLKRFVG
jgi:predicted glutamine amidotransferase